MRFDRADAAMEPALRRLWQTAFGDDDRYLDLFFAEYPAERFAMAAHEDGVPRCALYLLPLTVHCGGKTYPARYVYAVATNPDYRRRGLMRALLNTAAEHAARDGAAMLVTVPSNAGLFPYYAACGFETAFYAEVTEKSVVPSREVEFTETTLAVQKAVRDGYFGECELYGEWDERALEYRNRETRFLGGKVLAFTANGGRAYLAAVPDGGLLRITELAAAPDDVILSSAAAYFGCNRVWLRTPGGTTPFAMIRPCGDFAVPHGCTNALSLVLD